MTWERTVNIMGLEWWGSYLVYLRETIDGRGKTTSFRLLCALRNSLSQPLLGPKLLVLDDLILEVLRLQGEIDTRTMSKFLAMNQKVLHRRLHRLEWHGLVKVRQEDMKFYWRIA